MVPPGIPGRSDADFLPAYDPAAARALLAEAGYPGGAGFPATTLMTGGGPFDEAIVDELKRELGIDLSFETMGDGYFDRLADRPAADVGARLGRRLSGPQRLPGRPARDAARRTTTAAGARAPFDAAIAEAGSATDPAAISRRLRPGRGDRPRRRPGHPGRLRRRLGAVADRAAGRGPERARGSSGWRGWHGRTDAPPARRSVGARSAPLRPARRRRAGRVAAADLGDVRHADGDVDVRDGRRRSASR